MPVEIMYLVGLLVTIGIVFVVIKRPIYEAMFIAYLVMIVITGKYEKTLYYLLKTSTNTLFYAIVAFLVLAHIFGETNVVNSVINFILSIVGRIKGGAGYVSLIASTFMASLSGTGAGNVAATGVFTIPTMIKTGFPRFLAANVEMASSTMGCMIPPSGSILLAFAVLEGLYPGQYTLSTFWIVIWGIGIWFIVQRALTLIAFCKYYDVQPMPPEMIPSFKQTFKEGWKALLIPLVIFVPLFLDFKYNASFFTNRLGAAGAKSFSSCVILFTPGLAALYALIIARKDIPGGASLNNLFKMMKKAVKAIVPVSLTIFFAYSISFLYGDMNVGATMGKYIESMGMNTWQLALLIPFITALLGMIMPGSSQTAIFGAGLVGALAATGVNPLLAAAMLPAITGAMEGMTPPLALCMYTAMGISKSGLIETTKNCLVWVGIHFALSVVLLLGVLPILGM